MVVTAEAQKDNIVEVVKAEVSNYIAKPFTPVVFAEKIARVIPRWIGVRSGEESRNKSSKVVELPSN